MKPEKNLLKFYENTKISSRNWLTVAWKVLACFWDFALFHSSCVLYAHSYNLDKTWLVLIYKVLLNCKFITPGKPTEKKWKCDK